MALDLERLDAARLACALVLISEKARFHGERATPGTNLALGLAEIDEIAKKALALLPSI